LRTLISSRVNFPCSISFKLCNFPETFGIEVAGYYVELLETTSFIRDILPTSRKTTWAKMTIIIKIA
jgi:hypothetical protein